MGKHTRTKMPPSKKLSRKELRKEERKLKKARKDAFAHRNFDLIKSLKNVDTAFKAKCQAHRQERLKIKKKEKKLEKKEETKAVEDARVQGLKLAIERDEKELKQLEKNLNFRKKKGKTSLPSAFVNDGLDYILDATESEKLKSMEDAGPSFVLQGEDSDTDSGSEMEALLGGQDESDMEGGGTVEKWSPAKTAKSILKAENRTEKIGVKKNQSLVDIKQVRFAEREDEDVPHDFTDEEGDDSDEVLEDVDSDVEEESGEDDNLLFGDKGDEAVETVGSKKRSLDEMEKESDLEEDIYGRLRDSAGNIVDPAVTGAYIPPAKRAMMAGGHNEALQRRLKGMVNKVSEVTVQAISSQIEALYLDHSHADVNENLTNLIMEAVVCPALSPERLVADLTMLIAILHSNVGSEVGAFFMQKFVKKFDDLLKEPDYGHGKLMENVLIAIANVYNFKIIHNKVVFDIIEKLVTKFGDRDIELLLLILKIVGFNLRKEDPAKLKQVILNIQAKARAAESSGPEGMQPRIRFMLDVLTAVRNNNMRKIPNCDHNHMEHLKKLMKCFIRGQVLGEDQLTISLEDFLKADSSGRWWIVGSAWEGRKDTVENMKEAKTKTETSVVGSFGKQMLNLAKKQGMNTDIRRHIFCILGSSEDFEDAFARLLRLGLNRTQEREIIHVLIHCCLNEKEYNPFYSYLAQKFCTFDRRFMITIQFSMWDKLKEVETMGKDTRPKLAHFLSHLILSKALSLSFLKVIEFGMESKKMIHFLSLVLTGILGSANETAVVEIFERIAPFPKLKSLRQGLQVFMRIHLKHKKDKTKTQATVLMEDRIEKAETAMFSHQSSNMLL